MGKLLSLDLSTTSTGYALFDIESKELLLHGYLRPNVRGLKCVQYPKQQLLKMQDLASQIVKLVESITDLERIVIEEINRGVARLSQKTLDGLHFILMDRMADKIDLVYYRDSDGATGWRSQLQLNLSEAEKVLNKQRRTLNAKLQKGSKKLPIINKKHLAAKFVNSYYGTTFDVDLHSTDADVCDAIGLGHATLHRP